jgi:hypothetical protein
VAEWRKKQPLSAQWHDLAVEKLAEYLKGKDLFVIHPKRMTTREEKQVERMNDEFFGLYRRIKVEKLEAGLALRNANREAIKTAASCVVIQKPEVMRSSSVGRKLRVRRIVTRTGHVDNVLDLEADEVSL